MTAVPTVEPSTGVPDPLPDGLAVLDVREPVEWAHGHIEGAVHIPLMRARASGSPTCRTPRCSSSARSAAAPPRRRRTSAQQGHDAVNLDGGMLEWEAAGRPMVSETGEPPHVV